MPYLTLTLNGYPVDLPADAQVALSFRANDLRNLGTREASFSETFTLPLTAQVRAALGNPHALDSRTDSPYRLLPAVLTSPGGQVVLSGYGILEASHEGYDVTLTDALGGLFALVGSRELRDLDLSALDHHLTFADVQAAAALANAGAPYTYALADTGVLVPRPATAPLLYDELPAVVKVDTLLKAMLAAPLPPSPLPPDYVAPANLLAGYRLVGSLLDEPLYQAMVVPRATVYPLLRAAYLWPYTLRAYVDADRQYTNENVDIQFSDVVSGTSFAGTYYTPPPHAIGFRAEAYLPIQQYGDGSIISLYADLDTYVGPNDPATQPGHVLLHREYLDKDFGAGVIRFDVQLPYVACNPNTRLYLRLESAGNTRVLLKAGAYLALTPLPRALPGAPVHLEASLPALKQSALLTLLCQQFNLIIQLDPVRRLVRLDLGNALERRRGEAVDWSHLIDFSQRPRLSYRLGDYAQRNHLAYAEFPAAYNPELAIAPTPAATGAARGAGTLYVPNTTLPLAAEAYTADFFLPLPHLTATASELLPWLPFLAGTGYGLGTNDASKRAPSLWDSERDYDNGAELVLYRGQTWQNIVGTGKTTRERPPSGLYFFNTDQSWQVAAGGAYQVSNEELVSIALLVPYAPPSTATPRRVLDEGLHQGPGFVPAYTLGRDGLGFDALLPAFHAGLAAALRRVAVLTLPLRLGAAQIAALDFTRPVRFNVSHVDGYGQLSCLGYLNDIEGYKPGTGESCNCTFVVLGNPIAGLAPQVPNPPVTRVLVWESEDEQALLTTEDGYYILYETE